MKRRMSLLVFLPTFLAAILWARSYWYCDFAAARGWRCGSEFGAVYLFYTGGGATFLRTGAADPSALLEHETHTEPIRWLPLRTWTDNGDRFWAAQWWAVTSLCAAASCWAWRYCGRRSSGFEVAPLAQPASPAAVAAPHLSPRA